MLEMTNAAQCHENEAEEEGFVGEVSESGDLTNHENEASCVLKKRRSQWRLAVDGMKKRGRGSA